MMNWIKRLFAAGYDAAEDNRHHNRLQGSRRVGRDEDSMVGIYDRDRMRQRCINLRRNDAIVSGIVQRFAANVVGNGIMPQAKTSDPKWNDEAEAYYSEWSKVCDVRKRMNITDFQKMIVEQRILAGDCGFVMVDNGQLQPIESERITTPQGLEKDHNIYDGVKLNSKTGMPLAYYIFGRDSWGAIARSSKDYATVPRENFIHCVRANRFDQVRGIPELAPVIGSLQYVADLQKATLEKANMDAMNAHAIKREMYSGAGNLGGRNAGTAVDSPAYERFESGRVHYLRPGESVESLASNTPNPQYVAFLQHTMRIIGSALSLPYEFILLDFSMGSYSSSRAALLQTYRTFTDWQTWLTSSFLQRTWNWRIAKAIKNKDLPPAPIDSRGISQWYHVEWSYPEFGWVDPQNEAQANLLEWQLCTNTVTQMNRKKGRDVEDVMKEKGMEMAAASRIADEVNAAQGTSLTWKDIISAQIPGQTAAALPPQNSNIDKGTK